MALIEFRDLPDTSTPITADNLNHNYKEILNLLCPIGYTFLTKSDEDYSNYLGFTWERSFIGLVPVGLDKSQNEFNTIGKTGGSKYLQEHTHNVRYENFGITKNTSVSIDYSKDDRALVFNASDASSAGSLEAKKTGNGNSGNLQPYEVGCYWTRIK